MTNKHFVQVDSNNNIVTLYGCSQDPSDKPGYLELDEKDPIWKKYLAQEQTKADNKPILDQIQALEASVTPRRIREAHAGTDGKKWIADIDSQIATLRKGLK